MGVFSTSRWEEIVPVRSVILDRVAYSTANHLLTLLLIVITIENSDEELGQSL